MTISETLPGTHLSKIYADLRSNVDDRTLEILEHRSNCDVIHRRGWLVRRLLLVADVLGIVAAFFVAEWIVSPRSGVGVVDVRTEVLVFLASLPLWVVVAKVYGLYDSDEERTDHSTADDFGAVFHMMTVCTWGFLAGTYLTGLAHPTTPKLVVFWLSAFCLVSIGRACARAISRRSVLYIQNTVVVGAGEVGQLIAKKLLQHPEYGINLVGFVDREPKERRPDLEHLALLGDVTNLRDILLALDVERVIFAFSNEPDNKTLDLIRAIDDLDVQVDIVPRLFELIAPGVGIHTVEGLPLIGLGPVRLSKSSRLLKRTVDLIGSGLALLFSIPVFIVVAVAIKLDSGGSVFFRQVRMGRKGEIFQIIKFRTMVADADDRKDEVAHLNQHLAPGGDPRMFKVPGDPRITRVGRLLRRSSVDEIPQFLNVLRGEMSLVGPRPLILDEDRHVADWGRRRLDLKPGVTGLWQTLGRSQISFDEMVKLDYVYVTGWSLYNDLKLLLRTVPTLLRGNGAL